MEPIEYLRVLRRRWRLLAACVLVAGVAAWLATPAKPSNDAVTYTATHTLIRDTQPSAVPQALPTVSLYVKTGDVPERVAERFGYEGEPAVLASRVSLEPDEVVGTLGITASGGSPEEAADLANIFATETLAYLGRQAQEAQRDEIEQVNADVTRLQAEIDDLEERVDAAEEAGQPTGTLEAQRDSRARQYGAALDLQQQILGERAPSAGYLTLEEALPDLAEVEDGGFTAPRSRPARSGLAAVVGLLLGLGAVLVAERLDTRIRTRQAAEDAFGLPVIAEVPEADAGVKYRILTDSDPLSASAEAYRSLRAALLLTSALPLGNAARGAGHTPDEEPQVVLVTSPAPGDGKTTTVANVAAAFAETGRSVLVLGCDFRRPEIHKMFDVSDRPGISDVLAGNGSTTLRDVVRPTPVSGVFLAPSGPGLKNLGLVSSAGPQLIQDARELADLVIIDTAPSLATNEASEMLAECDAVVLISRVGRTRVDAAKRTRALLDRLGSTVLGVVLVGAGDDASTYYGSYYTSNTVASARRSPIPLRRTVRSDEIVERIQPWHGVDPTHDSPEGSDSTRAQPTAPAVAPAQPDPPAWS